MRETARHTRIGGRPCLRAVERPSGRDVLISAALDGAARSGLRRIFQASGLFAGSAPVSIVETGALAPGAGFAVCSEPAAPADGAPAARSVFIAAHPHLVKARARRIDMQITGLSGLSAGRCDAQATAEAARRALALGEAEERTRILCITPSPDLSTAESAADIMADLRARIGGAGRSAAELTAGAAAARLASDDFPFDLVIAAPSEAETLTDIGYAVTGTRPFATVVEIAAPDTVRIAPVGQGEPRPGESGSGELGPGGRGFASLVAAAATMLLAAGAAPAAARLKSAWRAVLDDGLTTAEIASIRPYARTVDAETFAHAIAERIAGAGAPARCDAAARVAHLRLVSASG